MEIEAVIGAGADTIMLPMFRHVDEIEFFLECVKRVVASLLFENKEAVSNARKISELPFDEVYIGLNDLRIFMGPPFAYEICCLGILDELRAHFREKRFGFGGITVLEKGRPLKTKVILADMARLKCDQVIIRRAFKQDINLQDIDMGGKEVEGFLSPVTVQA